LKSVFGRDGPTPQHDSAPMGIPPPPPPAVGGGGNEKQEVKPKAAPQARRGGLTGRAKPSGTVVPGEGLETRKNREASKPTEEAVKRQFLGRYGVKGTRDNGRGPHPNRRGADDSGWGWNPIAKCLSISGRRRTGGR